MISGLTFPALADKVIELRHLKRDFQVPQGILAPTVSSRGDLYVTVPTSTATLSGKVNDFARGQAYDLASIPNKYAEMLRQEQPELLEANLAGRFGKLPNEVRFVRAYRDLSSDNGLTVRAFLSKRYRDLDHFDLVNALAPKFKAGGLVVKSAQVTDRRLYIQAVNESLYQAVVGSKVADDLIAPGVVISNSEVGSGALKVEGLLFRKWCNNGAIGSRMFGRSHVGGKRTGGGNGDDGFGFEIDFSDATRELTDAALWAQLSETVDAAISQAAFEATIAKLSGLATVELASPTKAIEIVGKENALTEIERESMLRHLIEGGDTSAYGLWNALTRTAEDSPSYDRAVEIERLGGDFIDSNVARFSAN